MESFSEPELEYLLSERRLGRLATVDPEGMPHVVPVGWRYNRELGTMDLGGRDVSKTKRFRNVQANPRASFVVDDVLPPWRPRLVMVQGSAEALEADGDQPSMIRLTPEHIVSFGMSER